MQWHDMPITAVFPVQAITPRQLDLQQEQHDHGQHGRLRSGGEDLHKETHVDQEASVDKE